MMLDQERLKIYEDALRLIADDLDDAAPPALQKTLRQNIARAALVGHPVFLDEDGRSVKYRIVDGPLRGVREALYWPASSKDSWTRRRKTLHAMRDTRLMRKMAKRGGLSEE